MENICLIIDLDKFSVQSDSLARELGYSELTFEEGFGSIQFNLNFRVSQVKNRNSIT